MTARIPWVETGLLILAVAGAIVAVGLWTGGHVAPFGTARAEPQAVPPSGSLPNAAADRLRIVVGGIEEANSDLSAIPLSRDVLVALVVATPPDQRYTRTFDLRLYHEGSKFPVDNAAVKAVAKMRFMDHGTFAATALPTGDGHYLLTLPFVMSGEWQVEVQIAAPEDRGSLQVNLDVWQ